MAPFSVSATGVAFSAGARLTLATAASSKESWSGSLAAVIAVGSWQRCHNRSMTMSTPRLCSRRTCRVLIASCSEICLLASAST